MQAFIEFVDTVIDKLIIEHDDYIKSDKIKHRSLALNKQAVYDIIVKNIRIKKLTHEQISMTTNQQLLDPETMQVDILSEFMRRSRHQDVLVHSKTRTNMNHMAYLSLLVNLSILSTRLDKIHGSLLDLVNE